MVKLLINEYDLENYIKSFKKTNSTFIIKTFFKNNSNKYTCKFFIDSYDCQLDIYILKDCCKFVATGKNVDKCSELINYLKSICIDADVETKTLSVDVESKIVENIIKEILDENYASLVSHIKEHYKLKGYEGDIVNINIYENKTVIQAKPLRLYGIIITILKTYIDIDVNNLIDENYISHNEFIVEEVRNRIGNLYDYLDLSQINSLKSSYEMIKYFGNSTIILGDYSGILVGAFKTLEGYLRKVLMTKYGYKFKSTAFDMFSSNKGISEIDKNKEIKEEEKTQLKSLYSVLKNKRNVYLHGSGSSTMIITRYIDAYEILNEIFDVLKISYEVIFQGV